MSDITGGAIPGAAIPGDSIVGAGEAGVATQIVSRAQVMDSQTLYPVPCAIITPVYPGAPVLHFSTRNITVAGQIYEAYLSEISGISDEINRADSSFQNADITIKFLNDPFMGFTRLSEFNTTYPLANANCVIFVAYLNDDDEVVYSEQIFKGALDQLKSCKTPEFEFPVSSMPNYRDRVWKQDKINTTNWPNAFEEIGSVEPDIFGANIKVPAIRVNWGPRTTLAYNISETTTTPTNVTLPDSSVIQLGIMLTEVLRLGVMFFPTSGDVTIDDEDIGYTGIDSFGNLTGVTRAKNGTTPTSHTRGATVWIKQTYYDSLLARRELHSVPAIYAEISGELVKVLSGCSAQVINGKHMLRATSQIGIDSALISTLGLDQGSHNHVASSSPIAVYGNGASVSKGAWSQIGGVASNMRDQNLNSYCSISSDGTLGTHPSGTFQVTCPAAGTGGYVLCIAYSSGANPSLSGGGFNGQIGSSTGQVKKFSCPSCPTTITLTFNGDGGPNMSYSCTVYEMWYEYSSAAISYSPAAGVQLTGNIALVDTWKVDRFHALVNGYKSPSEEYGPVGSIIERPDYVIKYFDCVLNGFPAADINNNSFNNAGARYDAAIIGGYKFGFRIDSEITPSEFVRQLAYECRSTHRYVNGKWSLKYVEDYIPASSKTIRSTDLAPSAPEFEFNEGPIAELFNDCIAWFGKNYSKMGSETDWSGSSYKQGSADSIAKYGVVSKDGDLEFLFIRSQAMADHVLPHIIVENQYLPLLLTCAVPSEFFDLAVTKTFRIENEIYNNRLFYVESFKRAEDGGEVAISGRDWYGGIETSAGDVQGAGGERPEGWTLGDLSGSSAAAVRSVVSGKGTLYMAAGSSAAVSQVEVSSVSRIF